MGSAAGASPRLPVEKLAQLLVEDMQKIDGIWCLSVDNVLGAQRQRKRLKNDYSCRGLPVYPTVVEAGFLRYAVCLRDAGVPRPFPSLALVSASPILAGCT